MIKYLTVALPKSLYVTFKNKCKFYDIPMQEVVSTLLLKFLEGDFDKLFSVKPYSTEIPKIKKVI